jgi:hypothetical protein
MNVKLIYVPTVTTYHKITSIIEINSETPERAPFVGIDYNGILYVQLVG